MGITVLIPVFNGAATLRQAIDSILVQQVDGLEVLVFDDASTDASPSIALDYASRDPRVRAVLSEENLGLAATLNMGLEQARHELVARMDQDDEALQGRLERQIQFMSTNPGVVAAGSFVFNMGRTRRHDRLVMLPVSPRDVARTLPRENCLYHPSVVMRRSPVLAAGGYRPEFRNAEDYELWLRLSHSHDLANVPMPLLRYRISPGGMTLARKWDQLFYVMLAQQVYRDQTLSLADAADRASAELAAVDRRWFMEQVATSAVPELARLGLWDDAFRVLLTFSKEIRPRLVVSLAASVLKAQLTR
jgi:glycosyltransferase involved in cell wall biosynthesis